MKKLTIILMGLMLFMFGPIMADAATTLSISLSCKDIALNNTTTCTLTGKASNGGISGIEGKYSISEGATLSKYAAGSGWSNGDAKGGFFSNYTDSNKTNTFTIGTFSIKGTKVGKVTLSLTDVLGFDSDFNEIKVSNVSKTFNVTETTTKPTTTTVTTTTSTTTTADSTSTTSSTVPLVINNVKVDHFNVSFEMGAYYTTVNPETDKVTISATVGDGITISGTGEHNLIVGKNVIDLILRNSSGKTENYQMIITRPDAGAEIKDTKLKTLKIPGYALDFSPETKEYTISVSSSTNEIYVLAESYSDDVVITGDGLQTLKKGENTLYVRASHGDLKTTEYKITIKRSYMAVFMWFIIGILGTSLVAMAIYASVNRKAGLSKNNPANMTNLAPQRQQNGQNIEGMNDKVDIPPSSALIGEENSLTSAALDAPLISDQTTIGTINSQNITTVEEPQMIKTAPSAQVKVVKTTVVPVQQPQAVGTSKSTGTNTTVNKPII